MAAGQYERLWHAAQPGRNELRRSRGSGLRKRARQVYSDLRRICRCHQIILQAENGAWQRSQAPDVESLLFAIFAFVALYKKLQTFPGEMLNEIVVTC